MTELHRTMGLGLARPSKSSDIEELSSARTRGQYPGQAFGFRPVTNTFHTVFARLFKMLAKDVLQVLSLLAVFAGAVPLKGKANLKLNLVEGSNSSLTFRSSDAAR